MTYDREKDEKEVEDRHLLAIILSLRDRNGNGSWRYSFETCKIDIKRRINAVCWTRGEKLLFPEAEKRR
jgi:hypothetical protein